MEQTTDPYTPEERRRLERKGRNIVLWVIGGTFLLFGGCGVFIASASSPDPSAERYETCSKALNDTTPKAMWKHSDYVPGLANSAVDRMRNSAIGECMQRLEEYDATH